MTVLYPRFASQNIDIDNIVDVIENLDEFLQPAVNDKDKLPISTISMRLSNWVNNKYNQNEYLSVLLLVDINNIQDFGLRVIDGYFCNFNHDVVEGDGFVDIKTDKDSVKQAIEDIKNSNIPLHNRCQVFDYEQYPYIIQE